MRITNLVDNDQFPDHELVLYLNPSGALVVGLHRRGFCIARLTLPQPAEHTPPRLILFEALTQKDPPR